jgi:hypothetical protein
MARNDAVDLVQSLGAFLLALGALALAGWLENQGHAVNDWHKILLASATTYFFTSRRSVSSGGDKK